MKHVPMLIGWETYLIFASSSERKVGLLRKNRRGFSSESATSRQGFLAPSRREGHCFKAYMCLSPRTVVPHLLIKTRGPLIFLTRNPLLLRRARRRLVLQKTRLVLEKKSARRPPIVKDMELTPLSTFCGMTGFRSCLAGHTRINSPPPTLSLPSCPKKEVFCFLASKGGTLLLFRVAQKGSLQEEEYRPLSSYEGFRFFLQGSTAAYIVATQAQGGGRIVPHVF